MNMSFKLRFIASCGALAAFASFAHAEDKFIVTDKDKSKDKGAVIEIKQADVQPLIPAPEPTAAALILISLGAAGLVMKVRGRA